MRQSLYQHRRDTRDTIGVKYGLPNGIIYNASTFLEYERFPLSILCSLTHIYVVITLSGQEPAFVGHCLFLKGYH